MRKAEGTVPGPTGTYTYVVAQRGNRRNVCNLVEDIQKGRETPLGRNVHIFLSEIEIPYTWHRLMVAMK